MSYHAKSKDHMKWRGTWEADKFEGDGSGLTGLSAGTENDPIFTATSNALAYVKTESDPIFIATSNALGYIAAESDPIFIATSNALSYVDVETDPIFIATSNALSYVTVESDPIFIATSNALSYVVAEADPVFIATSDALAYVPTGEESDPIWIAASNAYLLVAASGAWQGEIGASNAIIASQALWMTGANEGTAASNALIASGSLWEHEVGASHAIVAHSADASDPHGAAITQTSMAISGDGDASGAAVVRNILIGVEATPGSAAFYTQGTIYMKYTA